MNHYIIAAFWTVMGVVGLTYSTEGQVMNTVGVVGCFIIANIWAATAPKGVG